MRVVQQVRAGVVQPVFPRNQNVASVRHSQRFAGVLLYQQHGYAASINVPDALEDQAIISGRLIGQLRSWVESQEGSREYADIAAKASADAISLWSAQQSMQASLFTGPSDSREIWQRADNGAGFCEVSRLFFSKFTERYLNYFLEREASASMASIPERDRLASELRDHIDGVSRFAFETSRITQSFAAGWFNNHARDRYPSIDESRNFLSIAFGKMREELKREADAHG